VTGDLAPLEVLVEEASGDETALPRRLAEFYGRLALPASGQRPAVIANFVETLDGVVTLDRKTGGGPISGKNEHDRAVMGILRAVADAVIVGAGTLRTVPKHLWTAEHAYPAFAEDYSELRGALGKPDHPLNVIVTGSGELDPNFAILKQTAIPVLVITSRTGVAKTANLPKTVEVVATSEDTISPSEILRIVAERASGRLFLSEAGPTMFGELLAARVVDDVFVTLAPQIAGRDDAAKRIGLVAGREFAPNDPRWFDLTSVRRAEGFLFLRYSLRAA
jgi:riboflavin biosynthesis pyrimidine reductase